MHHYLVDMTIYQGAQVIMNTTTSSFSRRAKYFINAKHEHAYWKVLWHNKNDRRGQIYRYLTSKFCAMLSENLSQLPYCKIVVFYWSNIVNKHQILRKHASHNIACTADTTQITCTHSQTIIRLRLILIMCSYISAIWLYFFCR